MSDASAKKRPGLGRGLSALLGEMQAEAPVSEGTPTPDGVRMLDIVGLRPMPGQPRKNFNEAALDELAESIRSRGLLQPIVVRESRGAGHYEIIAGERRWRAAQRAQLHQIPAIIRDFDDRTALELAIIENIQREQLSAWEEGDALRRLVDDHGHSQEEVARIVGKSRSHVANLIRLRNLPTRVHGWLQTGELTMGHARALLGSEDPEGVAQQIRGRNLSVRQTEALIRREGKARKPGSGGSRNGGGVDPDITALERQLSDLIGLKTEIKHQQRSGSVTLHYSTLEQLDMICQRLSGERI